jgi:hypothetical protein
VGVIGGGVVVGFTGWMRPIKKLAKSNNGEDGRNFQSIKHNNGKRLESG